MKKSPLAPKKFPDMPPVAGVQLATAATGIKYHDRDDLLLAVLPAEAQTAGVFTQSAIVGAPVQWCREIMQGGHDRPRALIVNAGNANTFTGAAGANHIRQICAAVGDAIDCDARQVLAASTGVIGELLPAQKILDAVPALAKNLKPDNWHAAANSILTTDTFAKGATRKAMIGDAKITINGIAKGSGMIAPNMATLLAFVFTDAALPAPLLQELLRAANAKTFNAISVDGDTSTSDTCLLFASCAAGNAMSRDADLDDFARALTDAMQDLALQIVRDGEGAQKLITIEVTGAASDCDAEAVAHSIANSPLVKTAIAGEDANWGRIAMAIGKSGARVEPRRIRINIGGVAVAENGMRASELDESPESKLTRHLAAREINIGVELGIGDGRARVHTCDLTHGYIRINADYRS